jgi:uncharacterized protein
MIVCIDTNTLVQATADSHPYHTILNAWLAGQFTWAVSTSILAEYQEIHERMNRSKRWRKFLLLMDLAELTDGNIIKVNPHYQFHVITNDEDDNKFSDCAIAAGADYLITIPTYESNEIDHPLEKRLGTSCYAMPY